jgi:hypothetical protein
VLSQLECGFFNIMILLLLLMMMMTLFVSNPITNIYVVSYDGDDVGGYDDDGGDDNAW